MLTFRKQTEAQKCARALAVQLRHIITAPDYRDYGDAVLSTMIMTVLDDVPQHCFEDTLDELRKIDPIAFDNVWLSYKHNDGLTVNLKRSRPT
jgi:hypothetical protein